MNTDPARGLTGNRILRPEDFEPSGGSALEIPLGPSVCGVDEAGRGPLAGPVSAAAVILPLDFRCGILDDSKAMSALRRERAYEEIVAKALDWAVAWSTFEEIGGINILRASLLAMKRAVLALGAPFELVVVDGNRLPDFGSAWARSGLRAEPALVGAIKGDTIVPAVMAASILAKVARDRLMDRLDAVQPEYGFFEHRGYPTLKHKEALRAFGPSLWQRKGFRY